MLEFLQYQEQTSQYYSDLMNKLERMNSTLGVMLHYLDNMQGRIEERLHMIQGYLGWAGETYTFLNFLQKNKENVYIKSTMNNLTISVFLANKSR